MELTQLSIVLAALGVWLALATLAWRRHRSDIQNLKRRRPTPVKTSRSEDIWSAGAAPDPSYSQSKQATTWVTIGAVGGCGGCGGCGCGG